jgi:hypothetical protein
VEGVVGVIDAKAKPRIFCLGYIAFATVLNASSLCYFYQYTWFKNSY